MYSNVHGTIHKSWHEVKKPTLIKMISSCSLIDKKQYFSTFECAKLDLNPFHVHLFSYKIPFISLFMVTTFNKYAPLIPP